MTAANKNLKPAALTLLLGGLLAMVAGFAYLCFTARTYQASARLKIEKRDWVHTNELRNPYDPGLAVAECRQAGADVILDQAIQNLGLNELWGKRHHRAEPFKTGASRRLLKSMTDVHPLPHSSLIEITITGGEREETASIANAIAGAYRDFRQAERQDASRTRLESLGREWDEQNRKVQQAQAAVDDLTAKINQSQATNTDTVYDPESLNLLQARRIEMGADYTRRRTEFEELKGMDRGQLMQVLPTLDAGTNSVLSTCFTQLLRAKNGLADVGASYPADSPEVKRASLIVEQLNQKFGEALDGVMTAKEEGLAALKAMLDALDYKLRHAATHLDQQGRQSAPYNQAAQDLENARRGRELLKERMDGTESLEALLPVVVSVEIMDPAEIPARPTTPNHNLVLTMLAAGGFGILSGLVLLWSPPLPGSGQGKLRLSATARYRPDS